MALIDMEVKMDYEPFIGKKITKMYEKDDWVTIECGKNMMSFRLISKAEHEILWSIKKITDEEIMRRKQSEL